MLVRAVFLVFQNVILHTFFCIRPYMPDISDIADTTDSSHIPNITDICTECTVLYLNVCNVHDAREHLILFVGITKF